MKTTTGPKLLATFTLLLSFLWFVTALVFYNCCLDKTISAMYRGESLSLLNHLIRNTDGTPLSYYLARGRLLFSYLTLFGVASLLTLSAALAYNYTRSVLVDFFTTPTSPLNLAIFRVAVFVALLLQIHPSEAIWFGRVPHELQMAPVGVGWLLPHLPVSVTSMTVAVIFLIVTSIMGIIGLFSRTSALLSLFGAFYVLGVPEFYGTVEHYHHLIWFLAILAVSRSGDALSVDAIRKASKREQQGLPALPAASVIYSLPLRFVCILIGAIYFFPGFWKVRITGLDWAFTDNLRYVMYARWIDLDGWTPFFRIDLHPFLYKSMALATLVFELSFILLVFFPRLRPLIALVGFGFHLGCGHFMGILFLDLWFCYVALLDVNKWLGILGRKLFLQELTVFYDSRCNLCRRTISLVRVLDVFGRLTFVNALYAADVDLRRFSPLDPAALLPGIHTISGNQTLAGFQSFRALAARVPFLWPIVPILRIPFVESFGNALFHQASREPAKEIAYVSQRVEVIEPGFRSCVPVAVLGVSLFVACSYFGARGIVRGWPFACYPRFAWNPGSQMESMEILALTPEGEVVFQATPDLHRTIKYHAFGGQLYSLLSTSTKDPSDFAERMKALWQLLVLQDPNLRRATTIRCFRVTLSTIPERGSMNPIHRELIADWKL